MKLHSFLLIAFLTALISCTKESTETTTGSKVEDSLLTVEKDSRYAEQVDSAIFHIKNYRFEVKASSKEAFDAVKSSFENMDTSEANRIRKYENFISRSGDSLIIKTTDGGNVYLVTRQSDNDDLAIYDFIQDMPDINQWLVLGSYWESYGYLLIDKTSGDTTHLYGMPVVSPDKKHIITFNQDLQAGFTFNGLQLLEMQNGKPVLIGAKELYYWGPDNVTWKNDHTLLVQQAFSNLTEGEQDMTTVYVELKMDQE